MFYYLKKKKRKKKDWGNKSAKKNLLVDNSVIPFKGGSKKGIANS